MSRRATPSQHPGQRLVRLVQIRQHRVKTKPGAIVHRRAFLLGMRVDQRRVDIDHYPLRPHPQAPRPIARRRTRAAQRIKQCRLAPDPIDQPERRRVRSDRTEQRLLIPDRPKIRQAIAAVGEHHREIPNHPAWVMPPATLPNADQRNRKIAGEPHPVSDLAEQRHPGMGDQTLSVRRDIYREIAPIALHLQGEPPEQILRTSNTHRITAQADSSAAPTIGAATAS